MQTVKLRKGTIVQEFNSDAAAYLKKKGWVEAVEKAEKPALKVSEKASTNTKAGE